MAVNTYSQEYRQSGFNWWPWLLAAAALGIILLAVAAAPKVLNGEHAIKKHAADAEAIHRCLDNGGEMERWQFWSHRRTDQYIQCGQLPDGRWGIRLIEKMGNIFRERTSFVVKNGTYNEMVEYISARAIRILP